MTKKILKLIAGLSFATTLCSAQTLPSKWEDLTSADFVKAIQKADGVCILPMGSLEKFGPSAPVGTNLYLARAVAGNLSVVFCRRDFEHQQPAGNDPLQPEDADGFFDGDGWRDGAQWLPEDHSGQRPLKQFWADQFVHLRPCGYAP